MSVAPVYCVRATVHPWAGIPAKPESMIKNVIGLPAARVAIEEFVAAHAVAVLLHNGAKVVIEIERGARPL